MYAIINARIKVNHVFLAMNTTPLNQNKRSFLLQKFDFYLKITKVHCQKKKKLEETQIKEVCHLFLDSLSHLSIIQQPCIISQVEFREGRVYAGLSLPCEGREVISDKKSTIIAVLRRNIIVKKS